MTKPHRPIHQSRRDWLLIIGIGGIAVIVSALLIRQFTLEWWLFCPLASILSMILGSVALLIKNPGWDTVGDTIEAIGELLGFWIILGLVIFVLFKLF